MKTLVKTSIKGYENLTVRNSVTSILEVIASDNSKLSLHIIHDNGDQALLLLPKEDVLSITVELTSI